MRKLTPKQLATLQTLCAWGDDGVILLATNAQMIALERRGFVAQAALTGSTLTVRWTITDAGVEHLRAAAEQERRDGR